MKDIFYNYSSKWKIKQIKQICWIGFLLDNIWVAYKTKAMNHTIATINGLSVYFTKQKSNCKDEVYALFSGPEPGLYKDWADVVKRSKHPQAHYKKYTTPEEAYIAIKIFFKTFNNIQKDCLYVYLLPLVNLSSSLLGYGDVCILGQHETWIGPS